MDPPIPFLGTSAGQEVVFLGLNPSYSKADPDPRLGSSYEDWDRWARDYFQATPRPWPELCERYQRIGEAAFGPTFELGRDAIVLECIRFRSAAGQGTGGRASIPVWEHEMPTTKQLIEDIRPALIVTVGTAPFGAMHGIFPALEPHVKGAFRLRGYEFQAFTTEAAWGPLVVIPSRHLTGVWGTPAFRSPGWALRFGTWSMIDSGLDRVAERSARPLASTLFVYSVADASDWKFLGTISRGLLGGITCDPDSLSAFLNRPRAMGLDPMMFLDGWSNGYISITHRQRA